jgi:hypothetical protein
MLCECIGIGIKCAAVRQSVVLAMRATVYGSAHGSGGAVRAVLCGSVLRGIWQCAQQRSVRLSGSVRQCAAVCGSPAVRGSVRQCSSGACLAVWQCVVVHAAVCGSARSRVRQCARPCVAMCTAVCGSAPYILMHKAAHNILCWYALTGAVGMRPIFLAY